MQSVNVNGKVLDFHYKKKNDFIYSFYIGEIFVGQLFNLGMHGWSAVGTPATSGFSKVDGFKSRNNAAQYLLRLTGYWKD